jgi:hypothetical protein
VTTTSSRASVLIRATRPLVFHTLVACSRTTGFGVTNRAVARPGGVGGATATQVRVQDPWFLFPVVLGGLSWLGLYLRDAHLRALLPFRT